MIARLLFTLLGKRRPRHSRFRGLDEPPQFHSTDAPAAPTTTRFELETRYGLREMQAQEWSLLLNTISCSICLFCAGLATQFYLATGVHLYIPILFVGFVCNRIAIIHALTLFRSIQLAVTDTRDRRPAGWTRHLIGMFPYSVWCPPGDLIAAAALLVFLRRASDHLTERQLRIFDRAELVMAIGFPIQYVYPLLLIAQVFAALPTAFSPDGAAGITISLTLTAAGLWAIWGSLRAMRRELVDVVQQIHWDVDPTSEFMANIPTDSVPEPSP